MDLLYHKQGSKSSKNVEKSRFFDDFVGEKAQQNRDVSSVTDCLWLVNIQAGHQPVKLLPGEVPDLGFVSWPAVSSVLRSETFVDQHISIWLLQMHFNSVTASAAEQKQRAL